MTFSTVETTSLRDGVTCRTATWRRLLVVLRERGHGIHESGAFLLGERTATGIQISEFIPYDDLDPLVFETGIVRFDGRYFGELWEICRSSGLDVVADTHTHPAGAYQSASDQAHPMIACAGHIAIVVPDFARPPVEICDVGVYRYLGNKSWETVP